MLAFHRVVEVLMLNEKLSYGIVGRNESSISFKEYGLTLSGIVRFNVVIIAFKFLAVSMDVVQSTYFGCTGSNPLKAGAKFF